MLPLLALLVACGGGAETTTTEAEVTATEGSDATALIEKASGMFGTLPAEAPRADNPTTEDQIVLGRMLYYDTRLSLADDVSCNTCHGLDSFGVDGTPTSTGHEQQKGGRNAPTVYNAGFHIAQFWDGRAATLEDQAKGPPLNPIEMAMPDASAIEAKFSTIEGYKPLFEKAFPDDENPVTFDNMALAIGAFERKLVTPAPFDAFLGGDATALSAEEQKGLETFMDAGCIACHTGALLGGSSYQKLGAVTPFEDGDMGRFDVTGSEADKQVFKVPSLRNITGTGPYFHHGGVATLEEAIQLMGKHQLGKDLTEEQVTEIVTFLGSLEGEIPTEYIAKPTLPE